MPRTPRVVIADDSPEVLSVIGDVLRQDGTYEVLQFSGATTAIDAIAAAAPDLLIVDLNLAEPDNGWRLVKAVRADPRLAPVPIILCSADVRQLRERADEIAALRDVSALAKPISVAELERLLHAGLRAR